MKKQEISNFLLETIQTQDDVREFVTQLDATIDQLYHHTTDINKVLDETIAYAKKEKIISLLASEGIEISHKEAVQKYLQELKKIVMELPVITLNIAFEPSSAFVKIVAGWLASHINRPIVSAFVVDRSLIGGAVISYQGKYVDFSMKKILDEKIRKGEISLMGNI